jgi:GWxTD domain-containing protein
MQIGLIQFDYDALGFIKDGKSRVDIYQQVNYNRLPFIKGEDGYKAEYTSRILIFTQSDEKLVLDKEIDKKVVQPVWKDEFKHYYDYNLFSFELPPDEYYVCILVKEKNTSSYNYKIKKVKIDDPASSDILMSDILLLRDLTKQNNELKIQPSVSANIPFLDNDSIYTFNEFYAPKNLKKIKISYALERIFYRDDREYHNPFDYYSRQINHYSEFPGKINDRMILFNKDTIIENSGTKLFLSYPLVLKQGNFRINIRVSDPDSGKSVFKYVDFTIRPLGFPELLAVNDKMDALRYILRPSEISQYDSLKSFNDRKAYLQKVLETMNLNNVNEYFKRVEYANERFTSTVEGWRTPMGMIYVVCGEPYQVFQNSWYYARYGEILEIKFYELVQRDKYPSTPRVCYFQDLPQNFVAFWWDCIEKFR